MDLDILNGTKIEDEVRLYTIKGDEICGVITDINDKKGILFIRKKDGNRVSLMYALIAGCEIIGTVDTPTKMTDTPTKMTDMPIKTTDMPTKTTDMPTKTPTTVGVAPSPIASHDFAAVRKIVQEQGVSVLPEWKKIENKYLYAAKQGEFLKKYNRIALILAELSEIELEFKDPAQYDLVRGFFQTLENEAEEAAKKAKQQKKLSEPTPVPLPNPQPQPPTARPRSTPMQVLRGLVFKAEPNYWDKAKYCQWTVRADDGQLYQFDSKNIADLVLLETLQAKFVNGEPPSEKVLFQRLSFITNYGKEKICANKVRRANAGTVPVNGQLEAKYREALKTWQYGKEHDEEVLSVFLEYFVANPSNSVAQNICSLYQRLEQPLDAVTFAKKQRTAGILSTEECLTIQYQAYRKAGEHGKAFEAEKEIIKKTTNIANKKNHIQLAINYLLSVPDYEKTLDYCEMWLAVVKKESGARRVSDIYMRQSICMAGAKCITILRSMNSGCRPSPALMEAITQDEKATAVLSGTDEQADEDLSALFSKIVYLGQFTRDKLDGVSLRSTPVHLKKLGEVIDDKANRFKGSPGKEIGDSAHEVVKSLTQDLSTGKPEQRYINNLYAARIYYDAMKSLFENGGQWDSLDNNLYNHLTKAFASFGDYALGASRSALVEEARFYYTESLKYCTSAERKQDRINALTRCVLSAFVGKEHIPMTTGENARNVSIQDIRGFLDATRDGDLNARLFCGVIARVVTNVPPSQENGTQVELLEAIYSSNCCNAVVRELFSTDNQAPPADISRKAFAAALDGFIKKYRKLEKAFAYWMEKATKEVCFKNTWVDETRQKIENEEMRLFFGYMDEFDRENCRDFALELLDTANKFCNADHYDEREDCLKLMIARMDERERGIRDTPAQYSYERLLKLLAAWRKTVTKELYALYEANPPEINFEVLSGDNVSVAPDGSFTVSFYIDNKKERQTADNVFITIDDENGVCEFVRLEGGQTRIIKGGAEKSCEAHLKLKDFEQKGVTVNVTMGYTHKDGTGTEIKAEKRYPLTVFFGETRDVEFDNPYAVYVKASAVQDRKMTFGREELIAGIVNMVHGKEGRPLRSKMLLLFGQKRAGKSTILYHLKEDLRKQVPDAILVEFGDISGVAQNGKRFEEFFYKTLFDRLFVELRMHHAQLTHALEDAGTPISGDGFTQIAADLRFEVARFFRALNMLIESDARFANKTVVILLDEFTYLYGWMETGEVDREFMKYWKAMINDYKLVAIAAAQDYIGDFKAAYPNQFGTTEDIPVDYLSRETIQEMIRRPFPDGALYKAFEHKMGEQAIENIMRLTAGNAFFAMIFLNRLVEYLNDTNHPFVMPIAVESVLKKQILSGNNPLDLQDFESLYNDDGDITDPDRPMHNLALLWAIAQQCAGKSSCTKEEIHIHEKVTAAPKMTPDRISLLIGKLVTRGVLLREDGRDAYRIRVDMFREWLLANCGADLINRQKKKANPAGGIRMTDNISAVSLPFATSGVATDEQFIGREDYIRRFLNRLRGCASIALRGLPRIGKTSLAQKLHAPENWRDIPSFAVYIDLGCSTSFADFWGSVAKEVKKQCKGEMAADTRLQALFDCVADGGVYEEVAEAVKALFMYVRGKGFQTNLCIDEFDRAKQVFGESEKAEFTCHYMFLREVMTQWKTYGLSVVIISRRSLEDLTRTMDGGSVFSNSIDSIPVRGFNERELDAFRAHANKYGLLSDDEDWRRFVDLAGRSPFMLSNAAAELLENDEKTVEQALRDYEPHLYGYFKSLLDFMRKDGGRDIKRMIQTFIGPQYDLNQNDMNELVHSGYIWLESTAEGERYKTLSARFQQYLREETRRDVEMDIWPLLTRTELALREAIELNMRKAYGDDWEKELISESRRRETLQQPFIAPKKIDFYQQGRERVSRLIDTLSFLEYSHIIAAYRGKCTRGILPTWTPQEIKHNFEILYNVRNPYAHSNGHFLTETEVQEADLTCKKTLYGLANNE
ncbi:MAG: hypothetical protein LBS62_07295 [Clostridiales bacterium]|nr:hypothetical protein [Clostridiales bacterium]